MVAMRGQGAAGRRRSHRPARGRDGGVSAEGKKPWRTGDYIGWVSLKSCEADALRSCAWRKLARMIERGSFLVLGSDWRVFVFLGQCRRHFADFTSSIAPSSTQCSPFADSKTVAEVE